MMQMTQKLNMVFSPLNICVLTKQWETHIHQILIHRQALNYEQRRHDEAPHCDLENSSLLSCGVVHSQWHNAPLQSLGKFSVFSVPLWFVSHFSPWLVEPSVKLPAVVSIWSLSFHPRFWFLFSFRHFILNKISPAFPSYLSCSFMLLCPISYVFPTVPLSLQLVLSTLQHGKGHTFSWE